VSECPACGFDNLLPVALVAELKLPISYPSQNSLGANGRGAYGFHYRKLRQEFAAALHAALIRVATPKATGKRRIWLKRIFRPGKRPYDAANLVGGGKHIVDVLVSRGLLKDDSPKWFEGIYAQEQGEFDCIHIKVYDIL
jgi:hypothetical protein